MFALLCLILFNFSSAFDLNVLHHEGTLVSNSPASGHDPFLIQAEYSNQNTDNLQVANDDDPKPINEKYASQSYFLLMLDTSNAMASNRKLDHLKTFAINWISDLRPGTYVAVVHYGHEASMISSWVEAYQSLDQLIGEINRLTASGGAACTVCGFKMAELLMLEASSDLKRTVLSITGQQDGSVGGSISDSSVWEPFKTRGIPVQTILYGTEGPALQVLTTETRGKYYTMMDFSRDGAALTDVSKTFIPAVVGDNYVWVIKDIFIPGMSITDPLKEDMEITDTLANVKVRVAMRIMNQPDFNIADWIDTIVITDESGNLMDGWEFTIDHNTNTIELKNPLVEPGKYVINVSFKLGPIPNPYVALQVKVTCSHTSSNNEPYIVECKYPTALENGEFLISSQVKQGYINRVSGATVTARITLSMDDDPTGSQRSCFEYLREDDYYNGDVHSFPGVYSHILDPRVCFNDWNTVSVARMTVLCTMFPSPDQNVEENSFWQ